MYDLYGIAFRLWLPHRVRTGCSCASLRAGAQWGNTRGMLLAAVSILTIAVILMIIVIFDLQLRRLTPVHAGIPLPVSWPIFTAGSWLVRDAAQQESPEGGLMHLTCLVVALQQNQQHNPHYREIPKGRLLPVPCR
jgi:hypothetical protein